ncbi:beta-N-acetylhexosaminidase [Mucilaginibacter paludis]|uniref:beta-N-acetylhexosaminidase n=1 Tax=Mucilaginibacter paludis DSM 18603 TaxID=714943 RepID=H1Y5I2_9SPHI|nr:beta-N-acetylhexosaminidase [Mucilaginibacter paludis]EHQ29334.1 Glycoside hydrolase, family 20, catalytic core [Mucilaginibacter paludis DSM 18603]
MKNLLLYLFLLFSCYAGAQQCPVIPLPNHVEASTGSFLLSNGTPIVCSQPVLSKQAGYLQQQLLKVAGLTLSIRQYADAPVISVNIDPKLKTTNPEAYTLNINPKEIKITAATERGIFYATTTLLQLVRLAGVNNQLVTIPCWNIQDEPRYTWRGILLDESRHFFGMETVKEILDWMAFYKLNKFHWHLTDEPGWRLQIKAYPLLALVGGVGTLSDRFSPVQYYTQEHIKEIIAYAAERFIDVIPEVDMPGHAAAANRAYPVFSGGGSAKYPDFTFNPGLDTTYTYLSRILKETDALFPSQMIHLGGDEVSFGNEKWKTDLAVKQLMQKNGLADLPAVEHYFTTRMADTLFKLNNKVLLWDEAADSNLPKDKTIIFWWRHDKPAQLKKALDKGYPVVLCPRLPFYFDFVQDTSQLLGRRWQGDFTTLDKLYSFTTNYLPVAKEQQKQILGVQAALWTEYIASKAKLEYMLFPRITALAEVGWTFDGQKDLPKFRKRVEGQIRLYQQDAIYHYNPFHPSQTPEPLTASQLLIKY